MATYQVDVTVWSSTGGSGTTHTCWNIEAGNETQAETKAFKETLRKCPWASLQDLEVSSIKENSSSNSGSSSSSSSLGELGEKFIGTVVLGVFTLLLCSVGAGSDEKATPVETPQPAAIERVEVVTPPAPAPRAEASASGPCVTENFEPC